MKLACCKIYFLISVIVIFLPGCDKYRIYETNIDINNKRWYADSTLSYHFLISDTTVKYHILYNVRNGLDYPYYNLYVKYALYNASDSLLSTDLHDMQLMDAKTGEPFGSSGTGNVYDNRFYALKDIHFPATGMYKITIKQYMRHDPLPEIYAFGVRIEKAKTE